MKSTAVVFKSKYGSTEKYANWIAEEAGADLFRVDEVKAEQLQGYQTIVYCGSLYAGGILGFAFIKKNYSKLSSKKLIVVAVGATSKKDEAVLEVKTKNLTDAMQEKVELFLLRGGFNYPKMNRLDRLLMWLLVSSVRSKKPEELDEDSRGLLATYGKVVDLTDRNTIAPVLDAIRK